VRSADIRVPKTKLPFQSRRFGIGQDVSGKPIVAGNSQRAPWARKLECAHCARKLPTRSASGTAKLPTQQIVPT